LAEARRNACEVIVRNGDVAVGNDEHLVLRLGLHVDEVRHFCIGTVATRIGHQRQIATGKLVD
jgi:hypothetical protein